MSQDSSKLPPTPEAGLPENQLPPRRVDPEVAAFIQRLQSAPIPATITLCVIIGALFALELALGATDQIWLLVRLGGLTPDALATGEVWRLVSSVFLHGGFGHVAFALLILWNLGGFVERVLGSARLLTLFLLSGLAGGVAALIFGEGAVTVGSSGGLWGLMVAQALLAWRPGAALPAPVAEAIRPAAMKNLGLNVLVSFLPGVSMAAHAGGGLVGLVLGISGLLTRGAVGEPAPLTRGFHLVTAGLLTPLTALGLGAALLNAELPTLTSDAPEMQTHPLEAAGLEVRLPALLGDPQPGPDGQPTSLVEDGQVYGDFLRAPYVVELYAVPGPASGPAAEMLTEQILDGVAQGLTQDGWKVLEGQGLQRKALARAQEQAAAEGRAIPLGEKHFKAANGARMDLYVLGGQDAVLRMDVVRWPDLDAPWSGLADATPEDVRVAE